MVVCDEEEEEEGQAGVAIILVSSVRIRVTSAVNAWNNIRSSPSRPGPVEVEGKDCPVPSMTYTYIICEYRTYISISIHSLYVYYVYKYVYTYMRYGVYTQTVAIHEYIY